MANLQTSTEAFNTLQQRERLISSTLTDGTITEAREKEEKKYKKNQATVTPDHYPPSTAFTNCIKGRLFTMMLQRKRGKKTSEMEYTSLTSN